MLKRLLCLLSLSLMSSAWAAAWYEGQWTCNLDGRMTEMKWRYEPVGSGGCDDDGTCWIAEDDNWQSVGWFKDVGRPWVRLTLMTEHPLRAYRLAYQPLVRGNTIYFEFAGDQTIWNLTFYPKSQKAVGNSVWRGKKYPLSCVRTVG